MMTIKGRVIGDAELKAMMQRAPAIYLRYFRAYLNYAGRTFIGNKKKPGYLRSLLNKKTASRGGNWESKFVNAAANFQIESDKMVMHAGIIYRAKKKIHEIMEMMESGYTKTNSGYMIVPNHKDLLGNKKPMGMFSQMLDAKLLRPVFKHGNIYFIHKFTNTLLFTGTRRIRVRKQWDFESAWAAVKPKIDKKALGVLDRATLAVERNEKKKAQVD